MLTDQSTSLVADTPGTTTDPVRRNMELPEAGPCVFIDTAGFDDDTELGRQRISLTLKALDEADIALLLVGENMGEEAHWQEILKQRGIPYAEIANKADLNRTVPDNAISISSIRDRAKNRTILIEAILRILPSDFGTRSITEVWPRRVTL